MVDRVIVYPGALPQDTDELLTNKFGLISESYQNYSILGTSTVVAGLACTPTAPASLQVNVGVGAIYELDPTDETPYGTLGTDTNSLMKQGLNQTPQTLTITPPTTSGFSQIFLVQVILDDVDAGSTVLSYYNSANPLQPFSGPNNAGSSNFTQRLCTCAVALKAGVAATTGSETAPAPDAGYIGLYTITVANGQTQITSANITQLSTAPFFPTLPSVPTNVQNNTWLWGTDTGAANAYAVTIPYPLPTAYVAGMGVKFKAVNTNVGSVTAATVAVGGSGGTSGTQTVTVVGGTGTAATLSVTISGGAITAINSVVSGGNYSVSPGNPAQVTGAGLSGAEVNLTFNAASTINVNGLGNVAIKRAAGGDVQPGDINSGQVLSLIFDGVHFQIENYLGISSTSITSITNNYSTVGIPYVADTGAQNAIVATFTPAITSQQQVAGLFIAVQLAFTITGACTINVNGLGAKNVTLGDRSNPPFNTYTAGMMLLLAYDGTRYQIVDSSAAKVSNRPTGNYTIYVNASTGSDSLYDGTAATVGSGTSGPFKTIQHALTTAYGYAPSQFTITIQVAAGTYNEAVSTPAYAGPNVVINGAGATATFVYSGAGDAFICTGPNTMTVQNLSAATNGVYATVCFGASSGAVLNTNNTASGACGAAVFYASSAGTLNPGNHTFNGSSATAVFWAIFNGTIDIGSVTFTIATPISAPWQFVRATGNGTVVFNNTTPAIWVNPSFVSGQKFLAGDNGVIAGNGLGVNYIPGSIAGGAETGGVVDL